MKQIGRAISIKPNKHLHSREHVLADDLSRAMGEPKRFAAYLGIARLYFEEDLRTLTRRVLAKEGLPFASRGKYFFAALKGLPKKPGIRFTRKRKVRKTLRTKRISKKTIR